VTNPVLLPATVEPDDVSQFARAIGSRIAPGITAAIKARIETRDIAASVAAAAVDEAWGTM
jgi:hypothetical protein